MNPVRHHYAPYPRLRRPSLRAASTAPCAWVSIHIASLLAQWGLSTTRTVCESFSSRRRGPAAARAKPQAAFFERHVPRGVAVLGQVICLP